MGFISCNALNAILLTCVSMSKQECKVRPVIINIISDESSFILTVFKWINAVVFVIKLMIHMKNCIPDVIKDMNINVFKLMKQDI